MLFLERPCERSRVPALMQLDAGRGDDLRAERTQTVHQSRVPPLRARYGQCLSVKRQRRPPVERTAQRTDAPDHDERRAVHPGLFRRVRQLPHGRNDLALCAARAVFDDRRRHIRRHSCRREAVRHLPERGQPHEEHERSACAHERFKVDAKRLPRPCVRGHNVHRRAEIAVRHRDTGERRCGERTRHARQHAERHAVRLQIFTLLTAAPKQIAVAALEADGALSLPRKAHQQGVDLVLRHGVMPHFLADADALRALRDEVEDALVHQTVIYDRVRLSECRAAAAR